jgi:hypothetical protein
VGLGRFIQSHVARTDIRLPGDRDHLGAGRPQRAGLFRSPSGGTRCRPHPHPDRPDLD